MEKRKFKIYFCLFTFIFLMFFSIFNAKVEASWGVQPYIDQIKIDLDSADNKADGEANTEYSRIAENISQMDKALQIIYNNTLSSIRSDENFNLPNINISSPLAPKFSRIESLREEIRQQLMNILEQYNEAGRRQYRQDITFINNITKESINYGKDIIPTGLPPGVDAIFVPGSTQEKVENAKILKQNVNAIQETREIAKALHEEFNRVRTGVFTDVDYHYKKLSTLTRQFDNVVEKHSWLDKGFADEIEKIRKEKEQNQKAEDYAETAEQRRQEKAEKLQAYTVSTYHVNPPTDEEARRALLREYGTASRQLSSLISDTQRRYNNIHRQLYVEDFRLKWVMRWMNPERAVLGGHSDASKLSLRQLSLVSIDNYLERYPERQRENLEKLSNFNYQMNSLLSSYKNDAAPILSTIRSVGNALGYSSPGGIEKAYQALLKNITETVSLMELRLEELPELIKNYIDRGNELSRELDRRISKAKSFVSKYKSEYNSIVYASIEYRNAADEASKALQGILGLNQSTALIWTHDGQREISNAINQLIPQFSFQISNVNREVKEMFKDGEVARIRNYLENIKRDYSNVIEKTRIASSKEYAIAIAQNQVDYFISQNREEYNLASALSCRFYASLWGNPLSDLAGWESDNSVRVQSFSSYLESQSIRLERQMSSFDELLEILPTLEGLDDYLASVYNSRDYNDARLIYFETFEELRELEDILDRWIGFRIINFYNPETEKNQEMKIYDIRLSKTVEASNRALERQRQERVLEELREHRNQLQELYNKGRSLQGYIEYYQNDDLITKVNNAKNAANYVLESDDYPSNRYISVANDIIALVDQIMEINNRGPIEMVEEFYDQFASAYSDANIRGVMSLISRDWQSSDGERRRDIEDRLLNLFNTWDDFIVTINVNNVGIAQRDGENVLEVNYYISIEGISFEHDFTYTDQGSVTDILSISGNSFMIVYTRR